MLSRFLMAYPEHKKELLSQELPTYLDSLVDCAIRMDKCMEMCHRSKGLIPNLIHNCLSACISPIFRCFQTCTTGWVASFCCGSSSLPDGKVVYVLWYCWAFCCKMPSEGDKFASRPGDTDECGQFNPLSQESHCSSCSPVLWWVLHHL